MCFLVAAVLWGWSLKNSPRTRLRENLVQNTRDKTGLGQKDQDRDRFLDNRRKGAHLCVTLTK